MTQRITTRLKNECKKAGKVDERPLSAEDKVGQFEALGLEIYDAGQGWLVNIGTGWEGGQAEQASAH